MTRLVAKITGDDQAAPGIAEDLVAQAEEQMPGDAAADTTEQ